MSEYVMVVGIVPAHHKEKEIQSHGFISFRCNLLGTKRYVPVGNKPIMLGGSKKSNIILYTSCKIGKIHALLFRLEKDGDIYISPANSKCRVCLQEGDQRTYSSESQDRD